MSANPQKTSGSEGHLPPYALQPRNVYDLMSIVLVDEKTNVEQKKALLDELRKGTVSDRWTFRWAIWILGFVVLLAICAIWHIALKNGNVPDGLIALGSAAAGGLAGLLTPARGSSSD